MSSSLRWIVAASVLLAFWGVVMCQSKYSWMWYDQYDEVDQHFSTVNGQNCHAKSKEELVLRPDAVSQLPVYNQLLNRIWYKNRTALIHLHNMALNRAFFYSYILQKMNDSASFYIQPNWLYMYMSSVADINANPYTLNGSAIYFDKDCHYPNWYETVPFNNTLPLFGPKAWRWDDWQDQDNYLREPTRRTAAVADLGAGRSMNYTHPMFKMNPWYGKWLPDLDGGLDSLTKFTYYVGIKYSNETGKFTKDEFEAYPFFGPSSPSAIETDERMLPVVWTQPYFDCGRFNKWVVSAVSPVVDYMPRYSNWTHLRRQRIVGVIVMDTEFKQTDFNACDVGMGNPGPSYLSHIHRCRTTTNCKHRMGMGFRRGGYNCPCKTGTKYPWNVEPPWKGEIIEQATDTEYFNSFTCEVSDLDQLEGVSIVGGTNDVSSGGLQLETQEVSSLVGKDVLARHIRSTNESTLSFQPGDGAKKNVYGDAIWSLQHGHVIKSKNDAGEEEESIMPVRPLVRVPYGMHHAVESVHDKRPITKAQINEALRRRHQEAQSARRDNVHGNPARPDKESKPKPGPEPRGQSYSRRKRASVFDEQAFNRMMRIFRQKDTVNKGNCHTLASHNLMLPGDVAYGVHTQFEVEARTALRLSHFLNNFLQNTDPAENFGNLRGGGRLHQEHVFGEVIANVMGNFKIYSAGVFFDRYMFENQDGTKREFFGPWAYRKDGGYYAIDTAGLNTRYVDEEWFQAMKGRWATNFFGLETYKMRSYIRSNPQGTSSIRHEHFPLIYKAPEYSAGYWTRPRFKCDGMVDAWVVTYVTPFFGLDKLKLKLEFKGVVTVDVPLNLLEINPCPQGFGVANAFKNTARCDYFSTTCSVIAGYPFQRGSYKCACRQGFEYPHYDGREWFQGSLLESEYEKKIRGLYSRYDQLYCRVAGASQLSSPGVLLLTALLLSWVVGQRQL
ncbi:hypothetical protein BaRGS_00011011 [Batillaria attramentaria]|uniref:GPR158/179 extracellular domain-containing protein n=1 Tax=Batillaria attramentaria TaxID=370345 RepID=A0ABD0LE50_9CAEN